MMDKIMHESEKLVKGNNVIHMEQGKNNYKIMIDLRPFDNDVNNLDIHTDNNVLTIAGRSVKKNKNKEQISRFQQSYMFGDNVDLNNLKKETDGEYLVVSLPINKGNND
jgi:HSP20 family molecular chaperone IbpA